MRQRRRAAYNSWMGIFGSASSKQVDEFAKALARELVQQCPPEPAAAGGGGRPSGTPKKLVATLEEICRKALAFKEQHKLGIYKKARLGNTFRWELTTLGYEKAFAEDVTQRLIVYIARRT
jgi:hypothetical protein